MVDRLLKLLAELMRVIDTVLEKHVSQENVNTVAEMIPYFSTNISVAQQIYSLKLIDGLNLKIPHSAERCINEEQWDEENQAVLSATSLKIAALASHIDLIKCDVWDVVLDVLSNHVDRPFDDVIEKLIWLLFMRLH
ncbi:hypothetical protein KIN20_004271 [Parelaphostrongylus tenuis]|uniref:Cohesin subunit SCC3/SA HEAT-repeats domain-containing protein n=1 Tax=Parelaphostrongylus tenuis TaxID=148309 RepID=A0AAD5LY69_PARTN|nr:hypothetical protein KIN20_004271 [Parelaphostrongylus tenuis]